MKASLTQALFVWSHVVAVSLARIKSHGQIDDKCSFGCKGKAEKLAHGLSLLFIRLLKRSFGLFCVFKTVWF